MTISTRLTISNSMSSFVPKYWLTWQILLAIFNEFCRQRLDHWSVSTLAYQCNWVIKTTRKCSTALSISNSIFKIPAGIQSYRHLDIFKWWKWALSPKHLQPSKIFAEKFGISVWVEESVEESGILHEFMSQEKRVRCVNSVWEILIKTIVRLMVFMFSLKAWLVEVHPINESTNKVTSQLICEHYNYPTPRCGVELQN